jgi:hydroxyethylthiazole kinase-like sugar kinase family protein
MTERNETIASETDKPSARRDSRLFEFVVGAGVLLISLISLFVAVSANGTQERMLAASVWPSLMFGTSSASPEAFPRSGSIC